MTPAALPAGWQSPRFTSPRVVALMTGRQGGVGLSPFDSFNLKPGIGDDDQAVLANRQSLLVRVGRPLVRLDQVHGVAVHAVGVASLEDPQGMLPQAVADACVTDRPGRVCEIQVADCLPVLMADRQGRAVAAAHAGWRGLAGGVVEAALERLCALAGTGPEGVEAWLGPCIGPAAFEVGGEVLAAFGEVGAAPLERGSSTNARFRPVGRDPSGRDKWWADLPGLARDRLRAAGVTAVGGNDGAVSWCTHTNAAHYFSYRRSPRTGRMSALIWLEDR